MGCVRSFLKVLTFCAVLYVLIVPIKAWAANGPTVPFSIEVTPSPVVATVTPGEQKIIDVRIRNAGNGTEKLKMELRDFASGNDGAINLKDSSPDQVKHWVTFSSPQFEIKSGQWFTQQVHLHVPDDAAFSYSFALAVSRVEEAKPIPGQSSLQGAVAVFALINVDRPGATRRISVDNFQTERRVYEYLPASFSYKIQNIGNSIVQPQGNIFIQRSSSSEPISVLKLNEGSRYILPGTSRTLHAEWSDGFPVYQAQKSADNTPVTSSLRWDWSRAEQFRFGHYVAKMVAIYNDGQRDVPIEAEIGFWVIPWKLLGGALLLLSILVVGIIAIVRKIINISRHARHHNSTE